MRPAFHRHGLVLALALSMTTAPAPAQTYPARPVHVVVPFAPGGNADILARVLSEGLTRNMGQPFVVDNRPGGSNIIATQMVARAKPDGYTLLVISNSHTVNPTVFASKLPYDTLRDFTGVAKLATTPMVLAANPGLGVNTVPELIAKAKAEPGRINFSSSGNGSSAHMAGELLNTLAGIKIVHVPYKGTSQGVSDTMSGQVQLAFPSLSAAGVLIRAGQLRGLGITTARRSEAAPDIPPIAETLPGFDASIWTAVIAPAGVPRPVISRLNAEIVKVLNDPAIKPKLVEMGVDVDTGTPEQLDAFIESDIKRSAQLLKGAIKLDMIRQ
ncbi:tripartite tricarboxylate transporter substrate binding protein [Pigmentiphaga soli]|uniref:Tripartite tricarboxylate transporter substrate binding protein n=1 Tax=Pigmentiphaga soli TaxID=1007095 RepID=A0ABP8H8Q2_9BURK